MPNVLNVCKANEILAQKVADTGSADARSASLLVILIHGYNTSEEEAEAAYETFTAHLEAAMRPSARGMTAVWQFLWPGDHANHVISPLLFSAKVYAARVAGGSLLAELWLSQRRQTQHVVLVGHSLGSRVVLEAAASILDPQRRYAGAQLQALFLLASAVPVPLCRPGESFDASPGAPRTHVFYSRSDRVLQRAFSPGEYLAGERGPAVGRAGEPVERWQGRHDTGLGHGEYWRTREVADRVAAALGLSTARHPAQRPLPEWAPFPPRPRPVRRLASRVLGQRVSG